MGSVAPLSVWRPAAVAIVLALAACHGDRVTLPTLAMDGTWERGGISGDRFGYYVMQLEQHGDRVTGSLCRESSGYSIFRDRPVTGLYPQVQFELPSGLLMLGTLTADDVIRFPISSTQEWVFTRVSAAALERCRSAKPPPSSS